MRMCVGKSLTTVLTTVVEKLVLTTLEKLVKPFDNYKPAKVKQSCLCNYLMHYDLMKKQLF